MSSRMNLAICWNPVWSVAVIAVGLIQGCAVMPQSIRDLPELPAAFAKDLAVARTEPVLITRPLPAGPIAPPSPSSPLPLVPARACTSVYEGYVTYPITICYPPSVLYQTLAIGTPAASSLIDRARTTPLTSYYKLTSHPLGSWGTLFCSVRHGPWYARVEGAQICNANPNIRAFRAEILGVPDPVLIVWSGALTDAPPPLILAGISQTGEFCTCCSGVMCPDGSCKPKFDQCAVKPPA